MLRQPISGGGDPDRTAQILRDQRFAGKTANLSPRNKSNGCARAAKFLALCLALSACGPHIPAPHVHPDRSDSPTAKPSLPIGQPEAFKPGLNKWVNEDGTHGAVFARGVK